VYCYTDYPEGELFVNGKSQGRIRKNPASRLDRYRLRWNNVKYEPGEVKVVVYDANGSVAGEKVMKTAGKPANLKTEVWTQNAMSSLKADGNDLAYVTVSLVDKNGTLVPDATDQLSFEVSGAGTFKAVCNGDATSLEVFTEPTMKLFAGQLVVVCQAGKEKGQLTLTVKDKQRKLTRKISIPVE
jgi:beta-galactosidase